MRQLSRGGTSYEKLRGRKAPEKNAPALPLFQFALRLLGAHAFLPPPPPIEAIHAVTIMSLKAIGLQLFVGTVLTSSQSR